MTAETTRRHFIRNTTEAAALGATLSTLGGVHAFAADSGPVRVALIGCGGIMNLHAQGFAEKRRTASVTWLCDVDPQQVDTIAKHLPSPGPRRTARYEDVLEDGDVDAVVIATPHQWHAPIAIRAMQAGKDVYCEKPISHVYDEGPLMIRAAEKYGRIVQQGSQMRSSPVTAEAERLLADGILGEIKIAKAWTAEMRNVVRPLPDSQPPNRVNYDRWLGPARARPFNTHRFHRTWRMFTDYGNGEIGDDGIHDLDMACWGLGVTTVPSQVTARGSRSYLHGHASDYPDNMVVSYDYADGKLLIYENYPFTSYGLHGFDNGNVFYGTEGYMVFSRRGAFSVFLGPKNKPGPTESKNIRSSRGYGEHMDNFLQAVRTRQSPRSSPQVAHNSCALVHLGEIAYRTRGRLDFDPQRDRFVNCPEADELLTKQYRAPYGLPEVGV
jgi:predicted dehydrogenase